MLKNLDNYFCVVVILALAGLLLVRTPFNGGFELTIRYLAYPLLATALFVAHASRKKNEPHRWMRYFVAVIVWPMLVVFSWPFLLVVNAAAADGSIREVSGPITEKFVAGTRTTSYVIKLLDQATSEQVDVPVSRSEWDGVKVGDDYKVCYFNGRFGVPYYWQLAGPPAC